MSAARTRNFATTVYPESAPDGWLDTLKGFCVPCFVSPLHDKDIKEDGTLKKPHYHVQFMFDGVKTKEQVDVLIKAIGGVGCEILKSSKGYARYLCHLDNPEKAQYNKDDVICICGSNYSKSIGFVIDDDMIIDEIIDFIDDYNVDSFYLLSKYASKNMPSWKKVIRKNAFFLKEYLVSRSWSVEKGTLHIIDENGVMLV